jgi:hypothetical protein
VDGSSASAVSKAFARASFLQDTRIDRSPSDAARRAARWARPSYAAELSSPGRAPGGAAWNAMAAHDGYTTVTATQNDDDGRPPDELRRAYRAWDLTLTPRGAAGWTGKKRHEVMYVTLTRRGGDAPWRVASEQLGAVR